jgi:hypothetical protein
MRVLVTGGRDFSSYDQRMWLYAGLSMLHGMDPVTELIEGGARGADNAAKNWALWRKAHGDKVKLTTVNAEWERFGPGAGPIRNREMAKLLPDVVLACPGGDGTEDMVGVAKEAGIRVVRLAKMPLIKNPQTHVWGSPVGL